LSRLCGNLPNRTIDICFNKTLTSIVGWNNTTLEVKVLLYPISDFGQRRTLNIILQSNFFRRSFNLISGLETPILIAFTTPSKYLTTLGSIIGFVLNVIEQHKPLLT